MNAGINDGDLLIVDRAIKACHGAIMLACLDGEFIVKRLQERPFPALLPANPDFPPITLQDSKELEIFGVVTFYSTSPSWGKPCRRPLPW